MEEKKIITALLEKKYQEQGLVRIQTHPTLDLKIINYSEKVTYENLWDENLLQYRALVYNSNYDVVAKSFNRFFNIEEERHIATDSFEVFEKLDGSLILVFWYAGQMIVASRGSFTSPYALEAKRLLDEKYPKFQAFAYPNTTYCFELIGFEQIVVSYPEPDLVLTGRFELQFDGWHEVDLRTSESLHLSEVKLVKKFEGLDWKNIKNLNWKNAEGFVVRFSNGQRCKIKFEDYLKLHRQMTNLSTKGIWEALAAGEPVSSILNDVPDEFYDKVRTYEIKYKLQYKCIEIEARRLFEDFNEYISDRGLFAKFALRTNYASIIFAMLDGKDYSKMIWKMIEPKFEKI